MNRDIQGILLDAYGVFWGGNSLGVFPGAKEAMEKLVSQGKIVGILSNSTQMASKEIDKIQSHGLILGKHFHFFLTSGEIARKIFLTKNLPFPTPTHQYYLLCRGHPKFSTHFAIFQETDYSETHHLHEADFLYVASPHLQGEDQTDPELFRAEIEKVKEKNLPLICPNPDRFAHEGNPPRAVVRQGSIAKMYEEIGGQVFYIGKPHPLAYETAMSQFHTFGITDPAKIVMVGDTPETDIRGARHFGMKSALITHMGIMGDRVSHFGYEKAIQQLPPTDTPDYYIERLTDDLYPA